MIDDIRCVWHRQDKVGQDVAAQPAFGGRVAAKRVPWAIDRARCVIERYGRRPLMVAEPGEPVGAAERSLLNVLEALRDDEQALARMHAAWLVRSDAVDRLLRALAPVAEVPAMKARAA